MIMGPWLVAGIQTLTFLNSAPVEFWVEVDVDKTVRISCDSNDSDTIYDAITCEKGRHGFLITQSRKWHCTVDPGYQDDVIVWLAVHEYNRGRDDVVIDYNFSIPGDDRGIRKL